jgi:phosphoribosylanthranilate isomerase
MTRIKLCGLRTARQAELAVELGADFIGLVFAAESRRRVSVEEARHVLEGLGERREPVRTLVYEGIPAGGWFQRCAAGFTALLDEMRPLVVGVFVDQPISLVNAIADTLGLDAVQLSGNEPSEQALEITRPVLKVIHVQPGVEPETLLEECEVGTAALYLLDTAMSGAAGGTGRTFEWELAAAVARQMPCVLAGGLTPDNVADAVRKVRPWGVDVSSGIESDGVKDEAKMRGFVTAVRDADERIFREQE